LAKGWVQGIGKLQISWFLMPIAAFKTVSFVIFYQVEKENFPSFSNQQFPGDLQDKKYSEMS
jgi:hypothetical protein